MNRPDTFNRDAVGNAANHKRAVSTAAALTSDNEAFKNLRAGFIAFFDGLVDADRLSRLEFGVFDRGVRHTSENENSPLDSTREAAIGQALPGPSEVLVEIGR